MSGDLESTSAAALIDIADALAGQYPALTTGEAITAAHELAKETARRLRAGQVVAAVRLDKAGRICGLVELR